MGQTTAKTKIFGESKTSKELFLKQTENQIIFFSSDNLKSEIMFRKKKYKGNFEIEWYFKSSNHCSMAIINAFND